jgi:hypothetical protein
MEPGVRIPTPLRDARVASAPLLDHLPEFVWGRGASKAAGHAHYCNRLVVGHVAWWRGRDGQERTELLENTQIMQLMYKLNTELFAESLI